MSLLIIVLFVLFQKHIVRRCFSLRPCVVRLRKLCLENRTYKMSELEDIDVRESAELFFKFDCTIREHGYVKYMHPIYQKVLYRRLREVGIPRKREIFPTKWARKASQE